MTRKAKSQNVPFEPDTSVDGSLVTRISLRLPDGSRASRRFMRANTLHHVLDYVDTLMAANSSLLDVGDYCVISAFPRVNYSDLDANLTLQEVNLHPDAALIVHDL